MDSQTPGVELSGPTSRLRLWDWWGVGLLLAVAWWGCDLPWGAFQTVRSSGSPLGTESSVESFTEPQAAVATAAAEPSEDGLGGQSTAQVEESKSATQEQRVLGVWRDFYRGERTLTLHEDGTGTMVVKLAGMAKKLFAETLQFDLTWQFEEGRLVMSTVDGRPASKFELIRKLYGDRADYEVLELTVDQMRLRDAGGKTEYDWRRLEKLYEDVVLDEQGSL